MHEAQRYFTPSGYISLHYISMQCSNSTLHCITLLCNAVTAHYIALHYCVMQCNAVIGHDIALTSSLTAPQKLVQREVEFIIGAITGLKEIGKHVSEWPLPPHPQHGCLSGSKTMNRDSYNWSEKWIFLDEFRATIGQQ